MKVFKEIRKELGKAFRTAFIVTAVIAVVVIIPHYQTIGVTIGDYLYKNAIQTITPFADPEITGLDYMEDIYNGN